MIRGHFLEHTYMALFSKEAGDSIYSPIPRDRVMRDLKSKLPGLFGDKAPFNIAGASINHNENVTFFPRRTMHPLIYTAVHAETGGPFDGIDIDTHTSLLGGWQAVLRGKVHGEPGFEVWWEGDWGDPNSRRVSIAWADAMPTIMVDTRSQIVFAGSEVKNVPPIGMIEFAKYRGGNRNRWVREVCKDYPVEPTKLVMHRDRNSISALLQNKDTTRMPFLLFLPLVLETRLEKGVPGLLAR